MWHLKCQRSLLRIKLDEERTAKTEKTVNELAQEQFDELKNGKAEYEQNKKSGQKMKVSQNETMEEDTAVNEIKSGNNGEKRKVKNSKSDSHTQTSDAQSNRVSDKNNGTEMRISEKDMRDSRNREKRRVNRTGSREDRASRKRTPEEEALRQLLRQWRKRQVKNAFLTWK